MSRSIVCLLFPILLVAPVLCGGDQPPVKCRRQLAGQFWPEAANVDPAARKAAERCGTLRYCARSSFGWHWVQWTVPVADLERRARAHAGTAGKQPGCPTSPALPLSNVAGETKSGE